MNTIIEPTPFNALMEEPHPSEAFIERYQQDMTVREMLHLKTVALFEIARIEMLIEAIDAAGGLSIPSIEVAPADDGFQLGAITLPPVKEALSNANTADPRGLDGLAKPLDLKLTS